MIVSTNRPDQIYAGTMQRLSYRVTLQGQGTHILTMTLPLQVHLLNSDELAYNPQDQTILVTEVLRRDRPYELEIPVLTAHFVAPGEMIFKIVAQDDQGQLYLSVARDVLARQ